MTSTQHATQTTPKAVLAGVAGGLAGTCAMNYVQRAWTLAVDGDHPRDSAAGKHDSRDWQERTEHRNSNELAANRLAVALTGSPLTGDRLAAAAVAVHFAFGAAMGALYGAGARSRKARAAQGAAFGLAVWMAADEVAMPALGLSASPARRPLEKRAQSMVAHLAFGIVAELTRAAAFTRLSA